MANISGYFEILVKICTKKIKNIPYDNSGIVKILQNLNFSVILIQQNEDFGNF